MKAKFHIVDLGFPEYVIGMHIEHDREGRVLKLNQKLYIKNIAEKFGANNVKPKLMPLDRNIKFQKDMNSPQTSNPYRELIGSLLYCILTRPDVATAVSILARYMEHPQIAHWNAAINLLSYLYRTKDKALTFKPDKVETGYEMEGFTDSSHHNCIDSAKSRGGFLVLFFKCLISWCSRMQSIVAQSSTEAEYVASNDAAKEIVWLRRMAEELGFKQKATKLSIDNLSAKSLATTQMTKRLTKHIKLRYHWVREQVAAGEIYLSYIPTKENLADAMTKIQPRPLFEKFVGEFLS